jgi:hypothetical protein
MERNVDAWMERENRNIFEKKYLGLAKKKQKKGSQPPVQEKAKAARKNQGICLEINCV